LGGGVAIVDDVITTGSGGSDAQARRPARQRPGLGRALLVAAPGLPAET
jgi:hypothetical protein